MWASLWTGAINISWPSLVPALDVGDLFSSSVDFGTVQWGHQLLCRHISQIFTLEYKRWKLVLKAASAGCSLFLVLFKTVCADWNCEMLWNGEHWSEYRQTPPCPEASKLQGWDCISKTGQVVVVSSKAKGCAPGRKGPLCLNAVHHFILPSGGDMQNLSKAKYQKHVKLRRK